MVNYNKICTNIKDVINYEKAKADNFKGWCLHHVLETHTSDWICRPHNARLSRDELIAMKMYYHRPANEFIFLTKAEHNRLHNYSIGGDFSKPGMKMSKEFCDKSSAGVRKYYETHEVWNKGVARTEKDKQTISAKTREAMARPEVREKISAALKGRHWYNNGVINKYCHKCPEGFVPGRLSKGGK